jgi:uncharacterized membrane protein
MSVLQVWLVVGIPALGLGLALFIGRSQVRAMLGYAVLLAGFGIVAAFDRASGAVFGGILALLYAAGEGGRRDLEPGDVVSDVPGMAAADRTLEPGRHA